MSRRWRSSCTVRERGTTAGPEAGPHFERNSCLKCWSRFFALDSAILALGPC